MLDRDFWSGRRVLVTGHTGFKGAWLVALLDRLDADVAGLSLPALPGSVFDRCLLDSICRSHTGDLRDRSFVGDVVESERPDVVVHMGAQALVLESYADPLGTLATNVMGTANLLEAVRAAPGDRAVVNVTSDKCYANPHDRVDPKPFTEDDPLGGSDPYSVSKACAELVGAAWRASFLDDRRIGLASARAGNVIGGGDVSPDRLVPDLLDSCVAAKTPILRRPDAVRPWQHVLNPLIGYLRLAQELTRDPPAHGRAWNFGPSSDDAISVRALTALIVSRWTGCPGPDPEVDANTPPEAHHLDIDSSDARRLLGWQPVVSLDEAISELVEFRRAVERGSDLQGVLLGTVDRWLGHIVD